MHYSHQTDTQGDACLAGAAGGGPGTTAVQQVDDGRPRAALAGQGPKVMAGLRVRMGINTGVPEDVFVHDVTEAVEYRGVSGSVAGLLEGWGVHCLRYSNR
jgi:hypothetical protein